MATSQINIAYVGKRMEPVVLVVDGQSFEPGFLKTPAQHGCAGTYLYKKWSSVTEVLRRWI